MKKKVSELIGVDFVRFCLVGTLGFIINYVLLTLLYKSFDWPIFLAQLVSSEIALFSNFLFHNYWTYKDKAVNKTKKNLLVQFHLSTWAAVLGSAAFVSLGVRMFKLSYLVSLIISSALALMWNYLWSKYVIWRHKGSTDGVPE